MHMLHEDPCLAAGQTHSVTHPPIGRDNMTFDDFDASPTDQLDGLLRHLQRLQVQHAAREAAWDWLLRVQRPAEQQCPGALDELRALLLMPTPNESGSEAAWRQHAGLQVLAQVRQAWALSECEAGEWLTDTPPWLLSLAQQISLSPAQGAALLRYLQAVREDSSLLCVSGLQRRARLGWQRACVVMMALVGHGQLRLVPAEADAAPHRRAD